MENDEELGCLTLIVITAIIIGFMNFAITKRLKQPPDTTIRYEYYTEATVTEKFSRDGDFWNSPVQQLRFTYKNGESIVEYVSLTQYNMFDKGEEIYLLLSEGKNIKEYYKTKKSLEDYITKATDRYVEVLELK